MVRHLGGRVVPPTLSFNDVMPKLSPHGLLLDCTTFRCLDYTVQCRKSGGANRVRTCDLIHAMDALSQLSYDPTS